MVSADEALSPVEPLVAALSAFTGELSRGDRTVLSPAWLCPKAGPRGLKASKQSTIHMLYTDIGPESIGWERPFKSTARDRLALWVSTPRLDAAGASGGEQAGRQLYCGAG